VVDARDVELGQVVSASGILGYLNFSDGRSDPRWQKQVNEAYGWLDHHGEPAPWKALADWLLRGLERLQQSGSPAFRDVRQAREVLARAAEVLSAYRRHHADLLAHLSDRDLFGPFFLVRVYEAVLAQRANSSEDAPLDAAAIVGRLNDFAGYRPIAILETRPQGEPYPHERHRPLPLFLRGAGVAHGPYQAIISKALDILGDTSPSLLAEAHFELALLDELALDLRAYDHGHPVNRRPNYVFGEWDPHHLDNQSRYRRFIVRKIALDALLDRVEQRGAETREESLFEGAAVLAGTMLMAAGISGGHPAAHSSGANLPTLMPPIARYRDAFYEQLLKKMTGPQVARLRQELASTKQAFGAARQHLNAYLTRHRATQLQQRYLAILFAEMGYAEASRTEARRIPTVSVRMLSEILGQLTAGQVDAEHGRLAQAAGRLPEIEDLLHRGIACGAFADPWNILGFQGLFPLSAAREDSMRDPRLDELLQVLEHLYNLYARLIGEAAANGERALGKTLQGNLERLAAWWDRFATTEVGDLRRVHGGEAASSARNVAAALGRWHQRGESSADLSFWRSQLDIFRSPKAYALVLDALLRKGDYRAALALLTSWLGQAEQSPLDEGQHSFHTLALRWMLSLTRPDGEAQAPDEEVPLLPLAQRRELVQKFFDYLEANAEDYWQAPSLEMVTRDVEEEDDDNDIYKAAYDEVTFQDSTDNKEGEVSDGGPVEEFDLERESDRLEKRLRFLATLARLWQVAARFLAAAQPAAAEATETTGLRKEAPRSLRSLLRDWLQTARSRQGQLLSLLDAISDCPLPEPSGDYDSLVEYDRWRAVKEHLLYTTIGACLDMTLAVGALQGAGGGGEELESGPGEPARPAWEPFAIRLEQALFGGEPAVVREVLPAFLERFQSEPLLFTPLTEGGPPRQILRVRIAHAILRALLANLPRLGLLRETFDLLRTARAMERVPQTRGRGFTEFNQFFQAAYQAVLESVIDSAATWPAEYAGDAQLVEVLDRLTTPFLALWIDHSRTLQISVLDQIDGDADWQNVQTFVQRYGADLFHARFLNMQNLRSVLHRGVGAYLDYLRDNPDPLHPVRLIDDLDRRVRRPDAVRILEIVLQAVVENYEEYRDYNTTTTQSDYGENLHVLLEFLRVKVAYDRHAWQFRPRVLGHEVLARRGRAAAAVLWEQALTQMTRELARHHLDQLGRLEQARGIRLGTVGDRLNERFVKPLALDRLCALIEPAMREARRGEPGAAELTAFARLRQELHGFTDKPVGVGLDVPFWLRRLEMEVHRVQATQTTLAVLAEGFFRIPRRPLPFEEIQRQLRDWDRPWPAG